ncbi:hypothetical protein [Symbiopectobacterium purcellii]|uniref:hypothetical protein n=1 Tax=Symbiopectobacterium purcellii TaxID=2871826 RepID=UPI003F8469E5
MAILKQLVNKFVADRHFLSSEGFPQNAIYTDLFTLSKIASQLNSGELQLLVDNLHDKVTSFKENATYLLNKIDFMSTGYFSEFSSTIPNLIFYFNDKKSISLTKRLGDISFEHNKGNTNHPSRIV